MTRPPRKPLDKRAVVEGARRAIHEPEPTKEHILEEIRALLELPADSFADGVRAEKHLRENICTNNAEPYGPYVEPSPQPSNSTTMGGRGLYVLFQPFMIDWFGRQNPEKLAAIDLLAMRQVRRAIFRQILKENWVRAVSAVGIGFAAFKWGVDAFEYVAEHMPAIKSIIQILRTGNAK